MVRSLRAAPAARALLYGQGGYVTKHHALVIGSEAAEPASLMLPKDVQDDAETRRDPVEVLQDAIQALTPQNVHGLQSCSGLCHDR